MFFANRLPRRNRRRSFGCTLRGRPRLERLEDRTVPSGPGALDPTFGSGGVVNVSVSSSLPGEQLTAIAIEPNGEILAAGGPSPGNNGGFLLAIFQANGTLDPNFGAKGVVLTSFSNTSNALARAMALEPNGQIVLAGYVTSGGANEFALARYNANGTLDTNFGMKGLVTTPVDGDSLATSVAIDGSGRIIAAGTAGQVNNSTRNFALARYTGKGLLDSAFGTKGTVETNLGPNDASAMGLALEPADGKIVAVGHSSAGTSHFDVLRYNTNGTLDTSFNHTGEVLDNFPGDQGDDARAVAIQPDGKIVAAGVIVDQSFTADIAVARYNTDGSPDTTFNGTGKTTLNLGGNDAAGAVVVQGNGKIVVAGNVGTPGGSPFLTARYDANGMLDSKFGTNGAVTTKLSSGGNDEGHAVAIQADGKIVTAGTAGLGNTDSNFGLVRYVGDPALSAKGVHVNATAGVAFTGTVATFTAADGNLTAGQFSAMIK
jgi:uncharacterized delta-60 repeat protein